MRRRAWGRRGGGGGAEDDEDGDTAGVEGYSSSDESRQDGGEAAMRLSAAMRHRHDRRRRRRRRTSRVVRQHQMRCAISALPGGDGQDSSCHLRSSSSSSSGHYHVSQRCPLADGPHSEEGSEMRGRMRGSGVRGEGTRRRWSCTAMPSPRVLSRQGGEMAPVQSNHNRNPVQPMRGSASGREERGERRATSTTLASHALPPPHRAQR